jgi:hypothetical protein
MLKIEPRFDFEKKKKLNLVSVLALCFTMACPFQPLEMGLVKKNKIQ